MPIVVIVSSIALITFGFLFKKRKVLKDNKIKQNNSPEELRADNDTVLNKNNSLNYYLLKDVPKVFNEFKKYS